MAEPLFSIELRLKWWVKPMLWLAYPAHWIGGGRLERWTVDRICRRGVTVVG